MQFLSLSIEKPHYLFLILLIFPAILLTILKFKKITRAIFATSLEEASSIVKPLRFSVFSRTILRCMGWIFIVLAFSEISFGTKKVPVHKSGSNVSFVFDISYSMLAKDVSTAFQTGRKKMSRLEAVKIYTTSLLEQFDSSSFSAVLAKGDGFVAVPETEDSSLMVNMIENLSPLLMTSSGSSLGKGIEAVLSAIPPHSAKSQYIWVFTDGDETDARLEKALEAASRTGIPVTLVGFGSENETEIMAGDGKTRVKTALRAKKLRELTENVNRKNYQKVSLINSSVSYIDSKETGSAWKLLNQIKSNSHAEDESTLAYELQKVNHHTLFIVLCLICVLLSFIFAELNITGIRKFKNFLSTAVIFCAVFSFSSCSSEKKQILDGVWAWYGGKYTSATANFLNTAAKSQNGTLANQYAVYDLSATYLSMNELDSALERIFQINLDDENLPKDLRTSAFYNAAIIYEQKGDYKAASFYFKRAVLADSENINAKINLELCERELVQKKAKSAEAEMQGVNEEKGNGSSLDSELFNLIRENEGKKWRNMSENTPQDEDVLDY